MIPVGHVSAEDGADQWCHNHLTVVAPIEHWDEVTVDGDPLPDPSWVEQMDWSGGALPLVELAARVAVRGEYNPDEVNAPMRILMEEMVVCPLCGEPTSPKYARVHQRVRDTETGWAVPWGTCC